MPTLICMVISMMMAAPAMAHGNEAHGSGSPWTSDPWIVLPLATLAVLYWAGAARLASRSHRPGRMRARIVLYCAGMLTLGGALLSPLHWLGEHLFTFHMVEHELVMAVSAPLIVLARPVGPILWGLPGSARRIAGSVMRAPLVRAPWDWCTNATNATILHGVAIWAWHMPVLFDAAVTNTPLHRVQHLSFFLTAILFWWAIVWRSDHGAAAWHLFLTMVHTSILGALMALAPRVLYEAQTDPDSDGLGTNTPGRSATGGHDHVGACRHHLCSCSRDHAGALDSWLKRKERAECLICQRLPLMVIVAIIACSAAFVTADIVRDNHTKATIATKMAGGDPARAPALFRRYGCSGCHTIPGIPGADGQAGAPLTELSKRVYIAGVLENRPDNLIAWIVSPRSFSPQTAMPETGISKEEARDLTAYLYDH